MLSGRLGEQQSEGASGDIAFLIRLVHELEDQLRRLNRMSDALGHDLAEERTRSGELQAVVEQLDERITAVGGSRPDGQDLLESIAHASSERSNLAIRKRHLEQRLRELLGGHGSHQRQSRLLHEELAEIELELGSVESQLSRALSTVEAVELKVKAAMSERDRLQSEVRAAEGRVAAVKQERDALRVEIAGCREALQKIQRGLADRL